MGSVQKHRKPIEEVDRLSDLPSSIISHILSFLPTKYAVRTSILSIKWKHEWRSITNIDFDGSLYSQYRPMDYMQMSFIRFVYRVMLLLKFSPLHKFRLRCSRNLRDSDALHINAWISAALLHDVREIEICRIRYENIGFLPGDLFTCQTLLVLKLYVLVLEVPTLVCLPNLKVLDLADVEFKDDVSIGRLLSSCPVLEDLTLLHCVLDNVLNISAPSLKKLVLDGCFEMLQLSFVLDAPQLAYLEFVGYVPEPSTLKNPHSLVEAHINFDWEELSLSHSITEEFETKVFGDLKGQSPVFLKLRKLEYGVRYGYGFSLLQVLLESSPQLETLVLYIGYPAHPENIPDSLWDRLKIVQLTSFVGDSKGVVFVKYILKNAKVLEKFDIYFIGNLGDITEELLTSPRASSSCEVVFQ